MRGRIGRLTLHYTLLSVAWKMVVFSGTCDGSLCKLSRLQFIEYIGLRDVPSFSSLMYDTVHEQFRSSVLL